jgi:hypothetical protein
MKMKIPIEELFSKEEIEKLTQELEGKNVEEIYTILRLAGEKKFSGAVVLDDGIFLAENYRKFVYDREVN